MAIAFTASGGGRVVRRQDGDGLLLDERQRVVDRAAEEARSTARSGER